MATFNFNYGFYLLLDDGSRIRFEKGVQSVPDAMSGHPYLAANGERVADAPAPAEEPAPAPEPEPAPAPEEPPQQSEPEAPAEPPDEQPADDVPEHDALVAQAEALGINVDGRWRSARLKAEIAKVTG